ncbi:MAG: hypothetical protein ACO1OQ_03030 [Rufibacter sp.]
MRSIIPLVLIFLLFSCSEQANDYSLLVKKDACRRNISNNEQIAAAIKLATEDGGNRPKDVERLEDSEKILTWRRQFMLDKTRHNLLLYSDSIESRYYKARGINGEFIAPLRELREKVKASEDSLLFYNLFYLTTVAESELLVEKAMYIGANCGPSFKINSFLDSEEYTPGDTVYLTFHAQEIYFHHTSLDFSKITCRRAEDKTSLTPKIIKSGPHYIFMFVPMKAGTYKITGDVLIKQEGNYDNSLKLSNEFKVRASYS